MKAVRVVVGERQRAKRAAITKRQLAAKREKRAALKAIADANADADAVLEKSRAATASLDA